MNALGIDSGGTSVKAAWLTEDAPAARTGTSDRYARPSLDQLASAVREAVEQLGPLEPTGPIGPLGSVSPAAVACCAPGQPEPDARTIRFSANIPSLNGVDVCAWLRGTLGLDTEPALLPDAVAAAIGSHHARPAPGRLLTLAMGTGIGAALLEDGAPARLGSNPPGLVGHVGQIDVSLTDDAPIGPDAGRGSLEAYCGLPALRARFGPSDDDLRAALANLDEHDPALRALARAIRIATAIYTPDHVRLLGGVGLLLEPSLPALRTLIQRDLTRVARDHWTRTCADDPHLAAVGAALSA